MPYTTDKGARLLHATLMGGEARVLLCDTTTLTRQARDIHHASRVAAAAMGRVISAAAIMGAQLKNEADNITLSIRGNGPAGAVVAVAHRGNVKITMDDPTVELPPREDGRLDVGGALGSQGRLSVVRDLGFGEPYIGQVALVSGEVAEDVAMYYTASEQIPSLCALGVGLGNPDTEAWTITAAGGLLVQAMPGCSEETLTALELRSPLFGTLSAALAEQSLEEILAQSFRGLEPQLLEELPLTLACDCSPARIERALISLGSSELQKMIDEQHGCEVHCHFCRTAYQFDEAALTALREAAMARANPSPEEVQ